MCIINILYVPTIGLLFAECNVDNKFKYFESISAFEKSKSSGWRRDARRWFLFPPRHHPEYEVSEKCWSVEQTNSNQ